MALAMLPNQTLQPTSGAARCGFTVVGSRAARG
jgi:hypothetical protein